MKVYIVPQMVQVPYYGNWRFSILVPFFPSVSCYSQQRNYIHRNAI